MSVEFTTFIEHNRLHNVKTILLENDIDSIRALQGCNVGDFKTIGLKVGTIGKIRMGLHEIGVSMITPFEQDDIMQTAGDPIAEPFLEPGTPALGRGDYALPRGDSTLEEGEFWCRFIKEPPRSPEELRRHHELTMADLDVYDISQTRVRELFTEFDQDHDGKINIDELMQGLKDRLDLQMAPDSVKQIVKKVKDRFRNADNSEKIHVKEFSFMLTRLRLAELFTPNAGSFQYEAYSDEASRPSNQTFICDYNLAECRPPKSLFLGGNEKTKLAQAFFFGSRVPWQRPSSMNQGLRKERDVRWVHVDASEGLDRLTLLRLAVKYHFHPLAVDDIIDNRTPTKLDRFHDYVFVSAEVIVLASDTQESYIPERVRIHRSNVSMFMSLPPYSDTLVTILQNRPDESSWMKLWRSKREVVKPDYSLWKKLRDDLCRKPPLRMRERKADFLLYEVLDRIVEKLRPITEAYAKRLGHMHQLPVRRYSQDWLDELDEVQLELRDLARSIRPMKQVLRHLIEDEYISFPKMYIEDVEDSLNETLDDLQQLQEMGKTLEEAHEAHRNKRMNDTLYVLSVVSAIFLPGQFVTGLYGMNFVTADGKPNIPELTWKNGYLYFWKLEGGILALASIGFILLQNCSLGDVFQCGAFRLRSCYMRCCNSCFGLCSFCCWNFRIRVAAILVAMLLLVAASIAQRRQYDAGSISEPHVQSV